MRLTVQSDRSNKLCEMLTYTADFLDRSKPYPDVLRTALLYMLAD